MSETDIAGLPAAVQRYLRFMGVVGRPREWSFRARFAGRFRMRPGMRWMPAEAWQYNSAITVARVFVLRVRLAGLIPMTGKDIYSDGHGRMLGKLVGLITVADGKGEEFDIGELTTYLNDAVLFAPSFLLRDEVRWGEVDANSFDVSLRDAGRSVSARVFIDERGAPVDFATTDRFVDLPGGPQRAEWRTRIPEWEVDATGRPVPGPFKCVWTLPEGSSPTSRAGSTQRASPSMSRRAPRRTQRKRVRHECSVDAAAPSPPAASHPGGPSTTRQVDGLPGLRGGSRLRDDEGGLGARRHGRDSESQAFSRG